MTTWSSFLKKIPLLAILETRTCTSRRLSCRFGSVPKMRCSKGSNSSVPVLYRSKKMNLELCLDRKFFEAYNFCSEEGAPTSSGKTSLSTTYFDKGTINDDNKEDYILQGSGRNDSKFRCGSVQDFKELNVASRLKHPYVRDAEGDAVPIGIQHTPTRFSRNRECPQVCKIDYTDFQYERFLNDNSQKQNLAKSSSVEKLTQKEASQAKINAIKILSRGPLTAAELRKKLIGKSFPSCIIEIVVSDLQRCGLQSDTQYAECFASSKWKRLSWGPMHIKQALKQRGVDEKIIEKAICEVFLDTDVNNDEGEEFQIGTWCMTRSSIEHLLTQARKQWFRGGDIPEETRKRRLIGWLQRRGFNWKVITEVLKSLETREGSSTKKDSVYLDHGEC